MNTENPPSPPLDSREAMLETLRMAYRFVLDQCAVMRGGEPTRLNHEDEKELGRRLAQYWELKNDCAVATALGMVAESDARMNTYTPTQRAALEAEGRAMAAYFRA